ncbi:hypothetical protein ABK040_013531 [Willaertia magna]
MNEKMESDDAVVIDTRMEEEEIQQQDDTNNNNMKTRLEIELEDGVDIPLHNDDNGVNNEHSDKNWKQNLKDFMKRLYELIIAFLPMGFISFGGPVANVSLLEEMFVRNRHWVTEQQFMELLAISQVVPGPTSVQVAIAIGTMYLRSYLGGIIACLMFTFPASAFLVVVGLFFSQGNIMSGLPHWFLILLQGLSCGAIAIIVLAAWKLTMNATSAKALSTVKSPLIVHTIIFMTCILFLLFQYSWMIFVLMAMGASISALYGILNEILFEKRLKQYVTKNELEQVEKSNLSRYQKVLKYIFLFISTFWRTKKIDMLTVTSGESLASAVPEEKEELEISHSRPFVGILFFLGFALLFGGLIVARLFIDWKPLLLFEAFFRVGSLIIGGGHVVVPLLITEFGPEKLNLITDEQFNNGFSLVSAMPGPLFNLSAYVGTVVNGVIGGIIGWIGLFLPGFLFIWGALPIWKKLRQYRIVKKLLVGVNSVAIGLIYSAVFLLWKTAVGTNLYAAVSVVFGLYLQLILDLMAPAVVFGGGLMRLVLYLIFEGNKVIQTTTH